MRWCSGASCAEGLLVLGSASGGDRTSAVPRGLRVGASDRDGPPWRVTSCEVWARHRRLLWSRGRSPGGA